jgi:hypothetical protein
MKKVAIVTFDYEMFLGSKIGTIDNCLINPVRLILEILRINNAKSIFFVDATWLLFLEKNFPSDLRLVATQLKNIISIGSSVELHLHPQWLDAQIIGDQIRFKSIERYRLHSLNKEEIRDLFGRSIDILERITKKKVTCFRAGGFCIEPFLHIKDAFEQYGIKYDFSVAQGMLLNEGKTYDFDFSNTPRLPYYSFQYDVKYHEPSGQYIEIPLSTYYNNPLYRIVNKIILEIGGDEIFGDGKGIKENKFYFIKSLKRRLQFARSVLTFDRTSTSIFNHLLKTQFKRHEIITIISHPKLASKQALSNLSFILKTYPTLNSQDLDKYMIMR